MTVVDFSEYFWGEKNEGFNVLYQNMKCGLTAAKELSDYLRELSRVQEDASKAHLRMVKQLSTGGQTGTFSPMLAAFKTQTEKLAAIHNQWMSKLSDLVKDVVRYTDELHKVHKKVKEDEAGTLEAVKNIQDTTVMLQKCKEAYKQRCLEIERLKRDSASAKDLEKSEAKFRKSQEDYKAQVEKYCSIRDDFEKKMSLSSKHFQEVEAAHLKQMRDFVESYCQIFDNNHNQWGRVHQELQIQLSELTVEQLLEQFALNKHTGLEKPVAEVCPIEFEEEKVSLASATGVSAGAGPPSDVSDKSANSDKASLGSASGAAAAATLATAASSSSIAGSGGGTGIVRKESSGKQQHQQEAAAATPPSSSSPWSRDKLFSAFMKWPHHSHHHHNQTSNHATAGGRGTPTPAANSPATAPSKLSSFKATSLMNIFALSNSASPSPAPSAGLDITQTHETATAEKPKHISLPPSPTLNEQMNESSNASATSTSAKTRNDEQQASSSRCSTPPPSYTPPPPPISVEEASEDVPSSTSDQQQQQQQQQQPLAPAVGEQQQSPSRSPLSITGLTGFLRRRQKKKKKDEGGDREGSEGEGENRKSQTPTPSVDDEPRRTTAGDGTASADPWADFNHPTKSFYSSSDESDDDTTKKKIRVEIKPVVPNGSGADGSSPAISASLNELERAVGGLEIVPPPLSRLRPRSALNDRILGTGTQTMRVKMKVSNPPLLDGPPQGNALRRSQSQSYVNNSFSSKPSQDLLGLSLHPIDPIDPVVDQQQQQSQATDNQAGSSATPPIPEAKEEEDSINANASRTTGLDTSTASSITNKEIRDIFDTIGSPQPMLPPKESSAIPASARPSSAQREKISNSLIALPRPPSRHGTAILSQQQQQQRALRASPSPIPLSLSRQDSGGSGSNSQQQQQRQPQQQQAAFGTSRGPSPLTLSMSDVVPLAVAFQEICHACFRGADESGCQVRLIGDMMVSFPAGIVQLISSNPNPAPLQFRIKNAKALESVIPNKQLISPIPTMSTNDSSVFEFHMSVLKDVLKKQAEMNPKASYFNIDILKYQIKAKPGAASCPLQMVAYWKCTDEHTDLRLDYKYNAHAMLSSPAPLLNLSIAVPVDGGVTKMQSKPNGTWIPESNRALWKFPDLTVQDGGVEGGLGSLRGRFELSSGPGSQGTIAAQFNCEGTTLSGVDIELIGPGYRLSLVKKRFVSGKYVCDGDATPDNRYRYAAPPSSSSPTTATNE